jgi:two-component system chemotaxis response regulator CheY
MAKVLVVDDSKFMRMVIKSFVERDSKGKHQVIGEAEDSKEAVMKYKELKPDIVTMDIIMPAASGLDAVRQILEFDPKAKIIMVTAMGQEKIIGDAKLLGAIAFVVKPVKSEEMLKAIESVL